MSSFWIDSDVPKAYRNLRDSDHPVAVARRAEIDRKWDLVKPYLDRDFPTSFAADIGARYWEFQLISELLSAEKTVVPFSERQKEGPDFLVKGNDCNIWIEAVTFGRGEIGKPDSIPHYEMGVVYSVPVDKIEMRISQAFLGKPRRFKEYVSSGIVSNSDILIVAICPDTLGDLALDCSDSERGSPAAVLYPQGDPVVVFGRESRSIIDEYYNFHGHVLKSNEAKVEMDFFRREGHRHISGVIWSIRGIGSQFDETSGLHFFHNFQARNPLPQRWLPWCAERTWVEGDEDVGRIVTIGDL